MTRGNSTMERIRADLLRRARTDRQQDENENRNGWIEQETGNNYSHSTEPPRTRDVLSRLPAFPRSLIAARRHHHSNPDGETPKSPTAPPRPVTLSSSRYGETGPPSSLPSPIPLSHMPDSPSPHPQGPPVEFGPDASNPFPRPADHLIDGSPHQHSLSGQPATDMESGRKPRPKRFMLCFPLSQSRRIRSQSLTCFVSGVFLASLLAVYLGLALTNHIARGELTIMIILVILAATIFFCYSVIRLCVLVSRGDRSRRRRLPEVFGPEDYVVPPKPIHVVLAQDEEAAGIGGRAVKSQPPAYGLWRESVRVDPNRLFWQRNESVEPAPPRPETRSGPRPPSYASDDGISYVVEARPRSIAPLPQAYIPASASDIPSMPTV
ncbi:hypothetical protein EsHS_00001273 [Epichloe bromicola]